MKKIFTESYDIEGSESFRVSRTLMLSKVVPMGCFRTGPDARCLLVLTVLHYFSAPIFWLLARREQTMLRIFNKLKKIASR